MDEKHQFVRHRSGGELITDCKAVYISESQAHYNSNQTTWILIFVVSGHIQRCHHSTEQRLTASTNRRVTHTSQENMWPQIHHTCWTTLKYHSPHRLVHCICIETLLHVNTTSRPCWTHPVTLVSDEWELDFFVLMLHPLLVVMEHPFCSISAHCPLWVTDKRHTTMHERWSQSQIAQSLVSVFICM
jgi:hypothetical protein